MSTSGLSRMRVEIGVGIDRSRSGRPCSRGDALRLGGVAADHRGQAAVLAIGELRDDHAQPVIAEADDRIAELARSGGAGGGGHADRQGRSGQQHVASFDIHRLSSSAFLTNSHGLQHFLGYCDSAALRVTGGGRAGQVDRHVASVVEEHLQLCALIPPQGGAAENPVRRWRGGIVPSAVREASTSDDAKSPSGAAQGEQHHSGHRRPACTCLIENAAHPSAAGDTLPVRFS